MAASPSISEINFREAKNGYDPEQVDAFLERLGDAVVRLQDKVREATRRADEAEGRALDAEKRLIDGDTSEQELGETLKRTLLLAQRTADDTVSEARAQAESLLDDARKKSATLLERANTDSARALVEAEREVDAKLAAVAGPVVDQLEALEARRDQMATDVAAMEKHLEAVRDALRGASQHLTSLADHPDQLRATELPVLLCGPPELLDESTSNRPAPVRRPVHRDAAESVERTTAAVDALANARTLDEAVGDEVGDEEGDGTVQSAGTAPVKPTGTRARAAEERKEDFLADLKDRPPPTIPNDVANEAAMKAFFDEDPDEPKKRFGRKR